MSDRPLSAQVIRDRQSDLPTLAEMLGASFAAEAPSPQLEDVVVFTGADDIDIAREASL